MHTRTGRSTSVLLVAAVALTAVIAAAPVTSVSAFAEQRASRRVVQSLDVEANSTYFSTVPADNYDADIDLRGDSSEIVAVSLLDGTGSTLVDLGTITLSKSGTGSIRVPAASGYCSGLYVVHAQSVTRTARVSEDALGVTNTVGCTPLSRYAAGAASTLALSMDGADGSSGHEATLYPYKDGFLDSIDFAPRMSTSNDELSDAPSVTLHIVDGGQTRTSEISATTATRVSVVGLPPGSASAWVTTTASDGTTLRSNRVLLHLGSMAVRGLKVFSPPVVPGSASYLRTEIVVSDADVEGSSDTTVFLAADRMRLTGWIKLYGPHSTRPLKTWHYTDARWCRVGAYSSAKCHGYDRTLRYLPTRNGRYVQGRYRLVAQFRSQEGPAVRATGTFRVHAWRDFPW